MSTTSNTPASESSNANPSRSCKVSAGPHDVPASSAGKRPAPPCALVIFGVGGDLTKRLLMPALYNLAVDGLLDDGMKIIGVNHGERETSAWRDDLHQSLKKFASDRASTFHTGKLDDKSWDWVAQRLEYMAGEFETDDVFEKLKQKLQQTPGGNVIFISPSALAFSSRLPNGSAKRDC